MNREIKFRAWLPDEKGWLADGFSISMDGKYWYDDNCHEWKIEGNLILMQFTGLVDENGKEIYEGDILHSFKNPRWFDWLVKIIDGSTCLINIGIDGYRHEPAVLTPGKFFANTFLHHSSISTWKTFSHPIH